MTAVLNTNMASLYAQKNLSTAQADLASSVQKLSSGKRINSAKDDAAGFAVAEAVKATKNVTDQSIQNTQDAISLVQTAEGALDVVGKILQRVLTLTTEKDNGSLTGDASTGQRGSINTEIATLLNEVKDIATRTKFQGGENSIFGMNKSFATGDGVTTNVDIAGLGLGTMNDSTPASINFGNRLGATTFVSGSPPSRTVYFDNHLNIVEAGGVVTDLKGEKFNPYQPGIIASNGKIHDQLLALMKGGSL